MNVEIYNFNRVENAARNPVDGPVVAMYNIDTREAGVVAIRDVALALSKRWVAFTPQTVHLGYKVWQDGEVIGTFYEAEFAQFDAFVKALGYSVEGGEPLPSGDELKHWVKGADINGYNYEEEEESAVTLSYCEI